MKIRNIVSRFSLICASAACLGYTANANTLLNDLVGYWNFETNFTDQSGNNVPSTNYGATAGVAGGVVGNGSSFERSPTPGDSLQLGLTYGGTSSVLGNNFTITGWYYLEPVSGNTAATRYSLWENVSTSGDNQYSLAFEVLGNGTGRAYLGAGASTVSNAFNLEDPEWVNITMTYQVTSETVTTMTVYINGSVAATTTRGTAFLYDNTGIWVGQPRTGDATRKWNGQVDEIAAWSRTLTADEIATVYRAGRDGIAITAIPEPQTIAYVTLLLVFPLFRILKARRRSAVR